MDEPARVGKRLLLLAGIMLVAVNLRPVIAAIGPLIGEIQDDTGLSAAGAGLLGAVPVLCFALVSGFAPRVGRRFGLEEVLLLAMIALSVGILLRIDPRLLPLFLGTAVIGIAIAFSNVLLPGLVKKSYPSTGKRMSGLYVVVLSISAAIASAIAIPLSETWLGWRGALGIWVVPAMAAVVAWSLLLQRRPPTRPEPVKSIGIRMLVRSRLAWAVILFMAAQALGFYIVLTWLTEILIDLGISRVHAGLLFSLSQLAGVIPILGVSLIADSIRDDRFLVLPAGCFTIAGVGGLILFGSDGAFVWAAMIGIGQGAGFALGLMFFVSRSANHDIAAELSGTGQSFAYMIAAAGPVLAGVLHDATESWTPVLVFVLGVVVVQTLVGWEAGRPKTIGYPSSAGKPET